MRLQTEWKLKWFEPGKHNPLELSAPPFIDHFWMTASVPGDVHSTLVTKNVIEDPFIGHNDLKCSWIEEKEWWYRTTFTWVEECDEQEYMELLFEGLDTYATIFLNGIEIGGSANMLVEHAYDVTRIIKKGKNTLAVKFDPLSIHVEQKERDYWCSYGKERIWTRKAAMNFGWDWGPRLVTTGIWKDVHLKKRTKAKLKDVFTSTLEITNDHAVVSVEADVERKYGVREPLSCEVIVRSGDEEFSVSAAVTGGTVNTEVEVPDPKLWWTHDLGEPHLYDLQLRLKDHEDRVIDEHHQSFGVREVKIEQKHENGENIFAFKLNGVRLFAKGANWIPVHSFIGAAKDDRYKKLLKLAKDSHMNMMRVWGGGIYEKDVFYEECDRLGMLVWQDFMFANALYPDYNKSFMDNVRDEVTKVIKRLRNHASLAIWCGNNEIDWIYDRKSSDGEITTPFYGEKIYHELIPGLLEKLDPSRLYWPSSPYGTHGDSDQDAAEVGDRHNWVVWHGNVEPRKMGDPVIQNITLEGVSFKNYKQDLTLFSSEFGMHASSNRYTLSKYIPEGEFYWKSDEMSYRNKDHFHEKGILLMEGFTGVPETIEQYMMYSMLTQAEGLKYGIEHYRRRKPFTSGALIWQLNDCWPGTSWSMIDYELLPKASFYYAKKFFDPVAASLDHDPGKPLKVWVVNDRMQTLKDTLKIEVLTLTGEKLYSKELPFEISENDTNLLAVFDEGDLLNGVQAEEAMILLSSVNDRFQKNYYYLRDFKNIHLPKANLKIERNKKDQTITVQTDVLARFICLDIFQSEVICSDNFFDLLPGEAKTVRLEHLSGEQIHLEEIQVSAINNLKD
jgi:beta-mannosidase